MLTHLSIRDVVLIDRLDLEFRSGLSVLTGETGAGKSILLDSLGLAIGRRAEAKLVRPGTERASVSAEFRVTDDHPSRGVLLENDIPEQPASQGWRELTLRRILNADGRSRAFVNDEPVGIGVLRAIGETLVEIQGQFDQHGLMDPATHLVLLDAFAGNAAERQRTEQAHEAWHATETALRNALAAAERAREEEAHLRFIADELDRLAPSPGEEPELAARRTLLQNAERLSEAIGQALGSISGDGGAEAGIVQSMRALERAADKAEGRFDAALEALGRAAVEIEEALESLNRVADDISPDGGRLEEVEERLFALRDMARKHRVQPDDLSALRDDIAARLELLDAGEDRLATLRAERDNARAAFVSAANALSRTRSEAASLLDESVNRELPPLRLEKAAFTSRIEEMPEDGWTALGRDRVSFVVATNPGMPPGPLDKIASGGELSRFLLAIKLSLAAKGSVPSLVFDEVDSGVGGATAAAVGERLDRLAESLQVLVVTHSPQVAARGRTHLQVAKAMSGATMATRVMRLDDNHRLEEVARMLAGAEITDEARAAARRLIAGNRTQPALEVRG